MKEWRVFRIIPGRFAYYSDLILSCEVPFESDIHNHCQKGKGQYSCPPHPTLSLQGRGDKELFHSNQNEFKTNSCYRNRGILFDRKECRGVSPFLERRSVGIGPITLFDTSKYPCKIGAEIRDYQAERFFGKKELKKLSRADSLAHRFGGGSEGLRD